MKAWLLQKIDVRTVMHGFVGVSGTLGGYQISLEVAEAWLKVASLTLGCTVGLITAVNLIIRSRNHHRAGRMQAELFVEQMRRARAGEPLIDLDANDITTAD